MSEVIKKSTAINDDWMRQAEEAVAAADVAGMQELVRQAGVINKKYAEAFESIISVYAIPKDRASGESESAIAAMREVSLAAIDLAKSFAPKPGAER